MKIVVGLGNPGRRYEKTPHNAGFDAVDALASAAGGVWEEKKAFNALVCRCTIGGSQVTLVKPQTFMNLSGDAVAPIVKYSNATPSDLVVIHDDIDLAAGRLRVRKGGSCGGHNGVRSIIERLGTQDFVRVKIGVGKDPSNVVGHVLGKPDPETGEKIALAANAAAKAAVAVLSDGPDAAMNAFNSFQAG